MKYTIWKLEDESPYTVTALPVKHTSSVKEAKAYFDAIDYCIITFFDSTRTEEINAEYLQDISEQLFEEPEPREDTPSLQDTIYMPSYSH